jgi:hypothetical protein
MYTVTIRQTTLASLPIVGTGGLLQGTLQSQLALGVQKPASSDDPGDIGNCADAQFRGAGSGGAGNATGCKVVGTGISCK